MTNSPDYRLYLEDKFETIEKSLDRIEAHLKKQNGAIGDLQTESNKRLIVVEDFRHLEKQFDCVKTKIEKIDQDLLEVWFFKKYPKVFLGVIAAGVLATLGLSFWNNQKAKDMSKKINYIEAYEKIPFAPERGGVAAYPDTSKVIEK